MRDLIHLRRGDSGCCPGHDKFPNDTYSSRRSHQARARDIKSEHQLVRQIHKRALDRELRELDETPR